MTDKKISELTALAGADMQATDQIVVARASTSQNFSMTRQEFLNSSDALLESSLENPSAVRTLANRSFATRAAAVTEWAAMVSASYTPPVGTVWTFDGVSIEYDGSTTAISDFSGWKPNWPNLKHWGDTPTDTELQAAVSYIASVGGILKLPEGEFNLGASISLSSSSKPFWIMGSGKHSTILNRAADYGSMISFNGFDKWMISDLTLNAGFSTYPTNANHGIVWYNCNDVRISNVKVTDYKNSAIIGYASPSTAVYENNLMAFCESDGLDNANNGILFADLRRSHIVGCKALNIGKTGSPCYGLQLKNGCQGCTIRDSIATGGRAGVACGNYDPSVTNKNNRVSNVEIFDCQTGLAWGNVENNQASDILIDMNSDGNDAVNYNTNTVSTTMTGVRVKNLNTAKKAVLFRSGDTDNYVEITSIDNSSGAAEKAVEFLSGALRNSVVLGRYTNPTTISSTTQLVINSSDETNTFLYNSLPQKQTATIATGEITVRDSLVSCIRVDTESAAATDDLDTINQGTDGQVIRLETVSSGRDVTVKNATGNIRLSGGTDFTLNTVYDTLVLEYKSAVSSWVEVSRSDNV